MKIIIFGSIDGKSKDFHRGKNLCFAVRVNFEPDTNAEPEKIGRKFIEKEFMKMGIVGEKISFIISYSDRKEILPARAEYKGRIFYAVGISDSCDEADAGRKKSLFNKIGKIVEGMELQIEVKNINKKH